MTPGMTPGGSVGGSGMFGGGVQRLPPEVNRILYIRNLPFNITPDEMYKIFGDYGAVRQIRMCVPLHLASNSGLPVTPGLAQKSQQQQQHT